MIAFVAKSRLSLRAVCDRIWDRFDLPRDKLYIQVEGAGPDDAWDYVTDCPVHITHVLDYKRPEAWSSWFPEAPEWNYKFAIFDPRGEEMLAAMPELIEGDVRLP